MGCTHIQGERLLWGIDNRGTDILGDILKFSLPEYWKDEWMSSDRWQDSNQLEYKMSERRHWGPYCKMWLLAVSLSQVSCFLAAVKASAGEKKQQESKEGKRERKSCLGLISGGGSRSEELTHLPGCWHLHAGQTLGAMGVSSVLPRGQGRSGCSRVKAIKRTPFSLASNFQRWSLCLRLK